MKYYLVESSHWPMNLEFKSKLDLKEGQCFRILSHDNCGKNYPTRFKVLSVSELPTYSGSIVEFFDADLTVEAF